MSRTKHKKPNPGFEYWTKRPISRKHGAIPGRYTKKRTHRLERLEAQIVIRKELNYDIIDDFEKEYQLRKEQEENDID